LYEKYEKIGDGFVYQNDWEESEFECEYRSGSVGKR